MPSIYYDEWPRYSPADQARRENTLLAAKLMLNAAFTAPMMGGIPQIEGALIWGDEEQEKIARKMEELARANKGKRWREMFKTEAVMVREADAVVLLGNYRAVDTPMDAGCGMCGGQPNCDFLYNRRTCVAGVIDHTELETQNLINGPLCMCRVSDLGEAVGGAMAVATRLLVDARPLMSVGLAGLRLGYLRRSEFAVGIPVASQAKSPFVDVLPYYHMFSLDRVVDHLRRTYVVLRQVFWYDYRTGFRSRVKKEEEE
jgi:uncharacterized ferredoxin-like protein